MARLPEMPDEFNGNPFMERLFSTAAVESMDTKDKKAYTKFMTTERDLRNQREFALEQATNKGLAEGIAIGKEEGIAIGIEQGSKQQKLSIARSMLTKGYEVSDIIAITGLTEAEFAKISNEKSISL